MFAIVFSYLVAYNMILVVTGACLDANGYAIFNSNTGLLMNSHSNKTVCSRPCMWPSFLQSTSPFCIGSIQVALTDISCDSKHVDYSLNHRILITFPNLLNSSSVSQLSGCVTKDSAFAFNYFTQAWIDRRNNLQILFTYSPLHPFAGDITKLNFEVTSLNDSKPLDLTQIHITLITNPNLILATNHTNVTANDFVSYNNISSACGIFYLSYRFSQQGDHQTILKIDTKDGGSTLASFTVPVLIPSQMNRAMYGIYNR